MNKTLSDLSGLSNGPASEEEYVRRSKFRER